VRVIAHLVHVILLPSAKPRSLQFCAVAMSIARDDAGNIRELHTMASGLGRNFRDASGGTGGGKPYVNPFSYQPFRMYKLNAFRQKMAEAANANSDTRNRKSKSVFLSLSPLLREVEGAIVVIPGIGYKSIQQKDDEKRSSPEGWQGWLVDRLFFTTYHETPEAGPPP
jgi:hypothetical protein